MKVVTVNIRYMIRPDRYGEDRLYKTFFDVSVGDEVIVKLSYGYELAKVTQVSEALSDIGMDELDYLVQVINPLAYENYVSRDKSISAINKIIKDLSTNELLSLVYKLEALYKKEEGSK